MPSQVPPDEPDPSTSPWRVHYGDSFFSVWAADADAAREHVERFGYTVTSVEPAPVRGLTAPRSAHLRY